MNLTFKHFVLLCLSVVLLASGGASAALLNSTAGIVRLFGWSLHTGWDEQADPCTYSGITCVDIPGETFQGVEINLAGTQREGWMAESPSVFVHGATFVTKLNLSHNKGITGTFPAWWASMTRLTVLDLSYTRMDGYIPSEWALMTGLEYFSVACSATRGHLPMWRGDFMTSIRHVDLSNSKIEELNSEYFGTLASSTTLRSLNLTGNPLCGCVNDEWRSNPIMLAAAEAAHPSSVQVPCPNDCVKLPDGPRCSDSW